MSMPDPNPPGSIVVATPNSDDLTWTARKCLVAARTARRICGYAPNPRPETTDTSFVVSAGDDTSIAWRQKLSSYGNAGDRWMSTLSMWETIPCGDMLRTLCIALPTGTSPTDAKPDGMEDLAVMFDRFAAACLSAVSDHPLPWLADAIGALADIEGMTVPIATAPCPWRTSSMNEDVMTTLSRKDRETVLRAIPVTSQLTTSIQPTKHAGFHLHDLTIEPYRMVITKPDAVDGMRAVQSLHEHLRTKP